MEPPKRTRIAVRNAREEWNEYLLDDGSIVRIKLVVTDIFRLEGIYDPEGNPAYEVKSKNIASVIPSEEVKKKSGE